MLDLPTGTVTFRFTDIEGSTRLLGLGERYADGLADHHRLLRASFRSHGGVELDTAGDAFFVAFGRATDAVAAAAAAQEALTPTGLRVRMGFTPASRCDPDWADSELAGSSPAGPPASRVLIARL